MATTIDNCGLVTEVGDNIRDCELNEQLQTNRVVIQLCQYVVNSLIVYYLNKLIIFLAYLYIKRHILLISTKNNFAQIYTQW